MSGGRKSKERHDGRHKRTLREANLQKLEPFACIGVADKVFVLAVPFTVLAGNERRVQAKHEKVEFDVDAVIIIGYLPN